jgi:hypothetical protein
MNIRLPLAAAASLAATLSAFAEIKLNEKFSVTGYVSGSAAYTETDGVEDSFIDVDSVKIGGLYNFQQVSGMVSLHSFTSQDAVVLDAFATYKASETTSVTVGKFLSYLGFEAFDYPNMLQISYANTLGAFIPAYHSGVKFDFSSGGTSGGFAILDSVYGPTYYKGDGDFDNGAGLEGYLKFTSGNSSLFAGVGFDDGVAGTKDDRMTFDLWAQTKAGNTTLAAEYCYSQLDAAGSEADGFFWLLLAMQPLNDKWTLTGRVSGGEDEALATAGVTPKFLKGTISPAVTITDNLGLLLEYSYVKYDDFSAEKAHFLAAQVIFKW